MRARDELVALSKSLRRSYSTDNAADYSHSDYVAVGQNVAADQIDAILANWTPQTVTEPDEDLVEAVAKAMFTADPAHEGFADEHWEGLCDRHPEVRDILDAYRDMARAALSVIPSRAEVQAEYFGEPHKVPVGYVACRTGHNPQVNHLVALDSSGRNGARPTMCGLTRFDQHFDDRTLRNTAGIGGWSMGGGVSGPNVGQLDCPKCWSRAARLRENEVKS